MKYPDRKSGTQATRDNLGKITYLPKVISSADMLWHHDFFERFAHLSISIVRPLEQPRSSLELLGCLLRQCYLCRRGTERESTRATIWSVTPMLNCLFMFHSHKQPTSRASFCIVLMWSLISQVKPFAQYPRSAESITTKLAGHIHAHSVIRTMDDA